MNFEETKGLFHDGYKGPSYIEIYNNLGLFLEGNGQVVYGLGEGGRCTVSYGTVTSLDKMSQILVQFYNSHLRSCKSLGNLQPCHFYKLKLH